VGAVFLPDQALFRERVLVTTLKSALPPASIDSPEKKEGASKRGEWKVAGEIDGP